MDRGATFVVEVIGEVRESVETMVERVAEALSLDDAKARVLVERMPGVITKPMPETRAAKVALRLQSVGLAAVHRSAASASFAPHASPYGPQHRAGDRQRPGVPMPEAIAEALRAASAASPYPPADGRAPSPLEGVPSIDATLIDESDVGPDPKLTPMTEAGFGAADIVVPTSPVREWPAPRQRFTAPILEGGSTATPEMTAAAAAADEERAERARAERARAELARTELARTDEPAPTMIRPASAEPDDAVPRYVRGERPTASAPSAPRDAAPRDATGRAGVGRHAPARDPEAGGAPSSRARHAIARDRASEGAQGAARNRPPALSDDEMRLTPPPDRAYRSKRTAAESMLTLTPPPDAVLKQSGVREDVLAATLARRRGAFGRRLSALVVLPLVGAWALGSWFVWLLLPAGSRAELWVPLVAATAVAALSGALVAGLATNRIAHDVTRLRDASQRIAMGDLTQSVDVPRRDEVGDISASVERMRVSLQESLERLRRRNR
jgi:HAMP domain-containing protein